VRRASDVRRRCTKIASWKRFRFDRLTNPRQLRCGRTLEKA
jgi:hypothetical protein